MLLGRVFKIATVAAVAFSAILTSTTASNAVTTPDSPLIARGVKIGAFAPTSPYDGGLASVNALESDIGRRVDVLNWFKKWGDPSSGSFTYGNYGTMAQLTNASRDGRTPMITWEAWGLGDSYSSSNYMPSRIASGEYDGYITQMAQGMKDFGKPVYIRMMHEMNGNWYPWSSEGGDSYIKAWQHTVDVFRNTGATNVKWVWAVNNVDAPSTNDMEYYWPGSNYVDVIGIDAYNCSVNKGWQSFKDLINDAYNRTASLDDSKPVWVTELGTCEPDSTITNSQGKTKADWYVDAFNSKGLSRLETIMFFNQNTRKDWTLSSSPEVAPTIKSILENMPNWVAPPQGTTITVTPKAPTNIIINRTYYSAKISWTGSSEANGYVIKKDGDILAYTTQTSYTDESLNSTQTYTYSIAAVNGNNTSSYTPDVASKPNDIILMADSSGSAAYLKFNSTAGNTYNILINNIVTQTVTASDVSTTVTVKNLKPNTYYTFQITDPDSTSVSDKKSLTTAPPSPTITSGKLYSLKTVISWRGVANAAAYNVYRDGQLIKTVPSNSVSYTDLDVASGTSYNYSVRSVSGSGRMSFPSNIINIWTIPSYPTTLTASKTLNQTATVSWSAVTNATSYALYRSDSLFPIKIIDNKLNTYEDTTVTAGQKYSYSIRTISNIGGVIRYSQPSPPTQVLNF